MLAFFRTLRGKLILTYTLVTVLALLALQVVILLLGIFAYSLTGGERVAYLSDVIYTLYPRAAVYLQPDELDPQGLQRWLDGVYESRRASQDPLSWFDAPTAYLAENQPLYVLSPERVVLAAAPRDESIIGQVYTPPDPDTAETLQRALSSELAPLRLSTLLPGGYYRMTIPVFAGGAKTQIVGALVLTVTPPPPVILQLIPFLATVIGITGFLLLLAVVPFAALFGLIMSRGLTTRLQNLTDAADAWSEGNFAVLPRDNAGDEISVLGMRMQHMAERIQDLLRTNQELAMLQERNRIARELHDTVKQQNFATLMQLRAARNRLSADPNGALESLQEAERLVKTSQQELGLMITELRPAALDGQGLARALETYLETWSRQSNIASQFDAVGETRLARPTEQALYRVAQEALANVTRHSRATTVHVTLNTQPGITTLTIRDNGNGLDQNYNRGLGLNTMQERMTALGGTLEISSAQGEGTTITAAVPAGGTNE